MNISALVKYLIATILVVAFVGCTPRRGSSAAWDEAVCVPRYATSFEIVAAGDSSTILRVHNPWQGSINVERELFIARNGELPPEGFEGAVVNACPDRVVAFSTSHIAFIDAIGFTDHIVGVSGIGYVSNQTVQERYSEGKVGDVGFDANINWEVLAASKPDLVFIYGVAGENRTVTERLDDLGIASFYIGDYLESTPLGKAEWVVAMGEIFDCRSCADSLFCSIEQNYLAVRDKAELSTLRPKVMLNAPYRDIWFVPGDDSYMVSLINDAGGRYICRGTRGNNSRALSGESAYLFASQADFWINPNQYSTLAELVAENPKFAQTDVVREGRVYNCNRRHTQSGGSDFWESGALYADRVLSDLFTILHPDSDSGDAELYYYLRLE